jgi:hypothetical protein
MAVREQLELVGLDETIRRAELGAATPAERKRYRRRVELAHELLSTTPGPEDLSYLHSGLCQTHLPRSRPERNQDVWIRQSGRFRLVIQPGLVVDRTLPRGGRRLSEEEQGEMFVGVPYGSRARLILIWLQSEGMKSRVVSMDRSMSSWIRSLGLAVTGGKTGTITHVKEQTLRIARCSFSLQWTDIDDQGNATQRIQDTRIVEGMELWQAAGDAGKWAATVELSPRFHEALREHAVPLDSRALASLAGSSLALDLYAFFAHRLHRLEKPLQLRWAALAEQFGGDGQLPKKVAEKIRGVLPEVMHAYPEANVEVARSGLILRPSKPPVAKAMVRGFTLITSMNQA